MAKACAGCGQIWSDDHQCTARTVVSPCPHQAAAWEATEAKASKGHGAFYNEDYFQDGYVAGYEAGMRDRAVPLAPFPLDFLRSYTRPDLSDGAPDLNMELRGVTIRDFRAIFRHITRLAAACADKDAEMVERDAQWMELIELCDRASDGLFLPLEIGQTEETLSKWTDWITTVLKNHGLARVVMENRAKANSGAPIALVAYGAANAGALIGSGLGFTAVLR